MRRKKPAKYTAQLPSTPCTPEMRQKVEDIATQENEGIAEIQRRAFALFLSENDKKISKAKIYQKSEVNPQ